MTWIQAHRFQTRPAAGWRLTLARHELTVPATASIAPSNAVLPAPPQRGRPSADACPPEAPIRCQAVTFWRWSASVPAWLALALACLPIRAAEVALTPVEQEILLAVFVEDSGSQSTRQTVLLEATSIRRIARPPGDYDRFCANLRKEAQGRDAPFREALEDLLRKNREPAKMTFPTNLPPVLTNTVLLSQARADALIGGADKADWREFEARFPQAHGLGTVSRIGLNAEQTVALVYYGTTRGPLSGMGTIHVLRLRNGKWTMTYESFGPGWRS